MSQQTSPFVDGKYGWSLGESGWNLGMDENLLKFSYLFDKNIDGVVSSLPSAESGKAYYLTTDNRIYFSGGNGWSSTPTPKWFIVTLKSTGATYQFNGSSLSQVPSPTDLATDIQDVIMDIGSLTKDDVGLNNVDNTSDVNKPVSSATQVALGDARLVNNIVVANLAALKALSTTTTSWAYRAGFTLAGDGGCAFYRYDPSSTATADDFMSVLPNSGTGRWLLNHNGVVSVKVAGAKGDGVTDDYTAILAAHVGFSNIEYPPGIYVSSSTIAVTAPFGFVGAGINKTTVLFTGATKGYSITQNASTDGVVIHGACIKTNTASTSTVGLIINGASQYTGDDTVLRIISDRTSVRCRVFDMDFRGTADTFGWGINLQFKSIINFSADNISWSGVVPAVPSTGALQGVGILINGNGAVIDFSLRRLWGYYTLYGVLMPDYLEGGHIYDYELVAVGYGILSRFTSGYSILPSGICGSLGMHIGQGHVNCITAGIILDKTNQCHIVNQNIYLQTRAVDAPGICVQVTGGSWNSIDSVFCNGDSALNTKSLNSGVILSSCSLSTITNISGSSLLSAVTLISSTENDFDSLRSAFSTYVINGDAGSTGNRVGNRRAKSNSGVLVSMASSNNFVLEEYVLTFTQVFASQTSLTVDVPLPVGTFSAAPDFGVMVADGGSIAFNFQYLYDTSTAVSAKFLITPQPPAANLGTTTTRFSINVKGK